MASGLRVRTTLQPAHFHVQPGLAGVQSIVDRHRDAEAVLGPAVGLSTDGIPTPASRIPPTSDRRLARLSPWMSTPGNCLPGIRMTALLLPSVNSSTSTRSIGVLHHEASARIEETAQDPVTMS